MNSNFNRLLKSQMVWLYNNRCKTHRHRYITHLNCLEKDKILIIPPQEYDKVGFLDIETTNLNASHGYIISYVIKKLKEPKYYYYLIRQEEILKEGQSDISEDIGIDYNLLKKLSRDLKRFNKIIVFYGKNRRFDIPFIRSRMIKQKIDFPIYHLIQRYSIS